MNDLIKMDNFDIEPSKAEQIRAVFVPMADMLEKFEGQFNEVVALVPSKETSARAKRLRLDIAKVRIATEKARVAQKEEYLQAGKAIDGVANILKFAVGKKETKLQEIETHFERMEAARIEKLGQDRTEELAQYECYNVARLGEMTDDVYANFLIGARVNFETRKEAERKAEEERLAKEAAELAERKRIWRENEELKKQAAEKEAALKEERLLAEIERKKQEAALALAKAQADAERKASEEANRVEREKLEAELKVKQEAEAKEKARIAKEEKKAKAAPDKDKLTKLAAAIDAIELPAVASEEAQKTLREVQTLLAKVSVFIKQRNEQLGV